jgi:glyceraldehyde-3-phosphate dehydrogenase (ferredoxin)
LIAKDMDATTKYRFDPKFQTGGTLGVNYATLGGKIITHNYKSIYWSEEKRLELNKKFITDHYLKQFNVETIEEKQQFNCGEPCVAVCKKLNHEFKKDYEPYQTMGPLCGIFDQRAAEKLNRHADAYGFDGISVGGVLAAFMECLNDGSLKPKDLGVSSLPKFDMENFDVENDSMHNANLGCELLDSIILKRGLMNLEGGMRRLARTIQEEKGVNIIDKMIIISFGRNGWMIPNQYWTAGALSPMAIMGKYYMHYGNEFLPPRKLGQKNAERFVQELIVDNLGFCRFHRGWAEEMLPDIVESIYGKKEQFLKRVKSTAARINSRNSSIFWESDRNIDFVHTFLKRLHEVENNQDPELIHWLDYFNKNRREAAQDYWYEIHKGISESLREFQ